MSTARNSIKVALRMIRVIDATEEPEADALADGLEALNKMLHGFENQGIYIDFEDIELTDEIPLASRDIESVEYLLAARLAPEYGRQLTPEVAVEAREAKATLQAQYARRPQSRPDLSITDRLSRYGNVYNIKSDGV